MTDSPAPRPPRLSRRTVLAPLPDGGLLFCGDSGKLFHLSKPAFEAAAAGRAEELSAPALATLQAARGLQVAPDQNNRDYCETTRANLSEYDRRYLYTVIYTASSCQLGCGYCGQTHDTSFKARDVLDPTFERIRAAVLARAPGFERLHVGWFGGEPLLGLRYMRELSARIKALAAEHGFTFTSKMPTNGLALTEETAAAIVHDCNCRQLDITLDGPKRVHDRRRMLKSGAPSFDKILANVVRFANDPSLSECALIVRCNLDIENVAYAYELVDLLAAEGLAGKIGLYFAPVRSWGNHTTVADVLIQKRAYADEDLRILKHLRLRGFGGGFLPAPKPGGACLTVDPSAEVIGPEGAIYKCTEHPLVQSYGPEVKVGHLGGAIPAASELPGYTDWLSVVERGEVPCGECEMFSVCGGSCPKAWNEREIPCPPPKFNIRERMLEVYQMNRRQVRRARAAPDSPELVELRDHPPIITVSP